MSEKSPKNIKNTCKTNIYKFRANSKKAQQVNSSPFKSAQVPWTYFFYCCCFAAKEDPSDELPNIPPPKQKKRTKPKLDAVKASKLATGLLTFLSPTRVPIRGGRGRPSSPQVYSPFSVRPVCRSAGVGGVQARHRSAHLSQSDQCADPRGWGASKLATGLLTFLSPTSVPICGVGASKLTTGLLNFLSLTHVLTHGGGGRPSSPQVCSPFSV